MTKVTIIGEEQPKEGNGRAKKIKFEKCLSDKLNVRLLNGGKDKAKHWANVVLIARKYDGNYDLMYAYETNEILCDGSSDGCLFLGHFNSGTV